MFTFTRAWTSHWSNWWHYYFPEGSLSVIWVLLSLIYLSLNRCLAVRIFMSALVEQLSLTLSHKNKHHMCYFTTLEVSSSSRVQWNARAISIWELITENKEKWRIWVAIELTQTIVFLLYCFDVYFHKSMGVPLGQSVTLLPSERFT
jgi:hypothetical protein